MQVADINASLDAAFKAVATPAERDDPSFWARAAFGLLKQSED